MRLWSISWRERLGCPGHVSVVGGQTARSKIVEIEGVDAAEVERRLG